MSVATAITGRVALRTAQLRAMAELAMANVTSRRSAVAPGGPVVSLTSYGKRARTVGFTIESIARGTLRPSRLILWLDEPQLLRQLPLTVRRLQRRGLEVRSCENYGPHKKYYPYVASQTTFDAPLVTADDDVIYPRDWLANLVAAHDSAPDVVHCYRARVMVLGSAELLPYASWPDCDSTEPSHRNFSVGLAGVLFPARVQQDLKHSGDAFRASCPRTDDIWLNLHAQRAGARVRQLRARPEHFMLLPGTQSGALLHGNVQSGNDAALRALYDASELARLRQLA
jgi:hypothetical protein